MPGAVPGHVKAVHMHSTDSLHSCLHNIHRGLIGLPCHTASIPALEALETRVSAIKMAFERFDGIFLIGLYKLLYK
jgi:hypothetical protein